MACSAHGRSFSLKTSELSQLSGITLRQFQHWDERGILRPRRAMGKCGPDMRVYGEREVFGALLRRECIRSGASVRWIGRCLPDIVEGAAGCCVKATQGRREYNTPLRPDEMEEIRGHDKKAGPMLHANLATAALWQRRALLDHCAAVHLLLARCLPYIERGYSGVADELVKEINSVLVEGEAAISEALLRACGNQHLSL
jgi:DNA-binding transcriptional MerR regulator